MGFHDINTSSTSESTPPLLSKTSCKEILERYKSKRVSSSISSSPEVRKEQTANKKLFAKECKDLRKHLNKSSNSNVLISNTSNYYEPQLENQIQCALSDIGDKPSHYESVLHFKKPLVNSTNNTIFYESRGRMEPMDWSVLNDENKSNNIQKNTNFSQNTNKIERLDIDKSKKETTINEQSKNKSEANSQFLNFVQNTTSSGYVYEVRNNIEKNPMELPMLILKRMLQNNPTGMLTVPSKIKQVFKNSLLNADSTDFIDKSINQPLTSKGEESNVHQNSITTMNFNMIEMNDSECKSKVLQDICEFDSKDAVSTLGFQNLDNRTRKKDICEYNDDMFNFIASSSNYSQNLHTQNERFDNENENVQNYVSKNIGDRLLIKEMQTSDFIISNSNKFTNETNVVEISNINIIPKDENLLKEISTRYFSKSLKNQEIKLPEKIKNLVEVQKEVAITDISNSSNAKELPEADKNNSLPHSNSNSSQELYLSYDNIHEDNIFTMISKNNDENCNNSLNKSVALINDDEENVSSSDKYEDNSSTIFCNCKPIDDTENSIVIKDTDNSKNVVVPFSERITDNIEALYEELISDEEFDIVNVNEFPPYNAIFNKLMKIKEAQKAIATGESDKSNPGFNDNVQQKLVNDRAILFDKSYSTEESSLEISDNHYSSIEASISSVAESDCNANASNLSNSLLNGNETVFAALKIDNIQSNDSVGEYYGKKTESKETNTIASSKTEISKRMKKLGNALSKCRQNLKTKAKEDEEIPNDESQKLISKRLQLLDKMKKRKAQRSDN